jgi:hypothetical protein
MNGRTSCDEAFRDGLHLSPLQYDESARLFKAQTPTKEGKNAGEAVYLAG